MQKRTLLKAGAALALGSATVMGNAQSAAATWPSRPIRIVLPFPAGGSTDSVVRILTEAMSASMGQPFIIESKPGADGSIAAQFVSRADPDGYTLFVATNTALMQVFLLRKKPPYDPIKDFTPVSLMGRYINVLVVDPKLPVKDAREFVAYAKARQGAVNYGTYSSTTQIMGTRFKSESGIDFNVVPYKGESLTVMDILGGSIQATFATPTTTLGYINTGKLKALAVLLPERTSLLPDVPTGAEAGLPAASAGNWVALVGPANLASDVTQRLNRELNAAMNRPEIRARIEALGFQLAGLSAPDTATFLENQLTAWRGAYQEAGMQAE